MTTTSLQTELDALWQDRVPWNMNRALIPNQEGLQVQVLTRSGITNSRVLCGGQGHYLEGVHISEVRAWRRRFHMVLSG
jgi:hypothetical protein